MVLTASLPFLTLALLACSGDGKETDTAAAPSEEALAELDLSDTLQADAAGCQDHNGMTTTGAASYFVDVLVLRDRTAGARTWQGTERWFLFANDTWRAAGQEDCVMTWTLEATETEPGSCSTCDYGMELRATLDEGNTSCPQGLAARMNTAPFRYAVDPADDHTARVYFADGDALSDRAVWSDAGLGLVTARACRWF